MITEIRASALPMLRNCAASIVPPTTSISWIDDLPARTGTAAHQVIAHWVREDYPDESVIAGVAGQHEIEDPMELSILSWSGWKCWTEIRHHFPDPQMEIERETTRDGIRVTGHPDLESIVGTQGRILDWKTGWLDTHYKWQLRAYALMMLDRDSSLDSVYACVIRVRDKQLDSWNWRRAEMESWWRQVRDWLQHADEYSPNAKWCRFCRRALECPARLQVLQSGRSLAGVTLDKIADGFDLTTLPADEILSLYHAAKDTVAAAETLLDGVRSAVALSNGRGIEANGEKLVLSLTSPRKITDTKKAMAVLGTWLSPDEILAAARLSVTSVEAAASARAPRGQKTAVKNDVAASLHDAGCIETSVVERLELKRV